MLTAEYAVLDGAIALALPTALGQSLKIKSNSSKQLYWKSLDEKGAIWYEDKFSLDEVLSNETLSFKNEFSKRLIEILRSVRVQNPFFLTSEEGLDITTTLEFNRHWGLGSSSTLINNIANWANVNAFKLLQDTFGGSGYDIACAKYDIPILYQHINLDKPYIEPVDFRPPFSSQLYFVYLEEKQNSREGIANYKRLNKISETVISRLNNITKQIVDCQTIDLFNELIVAHEVMIGEIIDQTPIKLRLFKDFNGEIKSLGAWGGDFILATSKNDPTAYFSSKGYTTIIPYSKLILDK